MNNNKLHSLLQGLSDEIASIKSISNNKFEVTGVNSDLENLSVTVACKDCDTTFSVAAEDIDKIRDSTYLCPSCDISDLHFTAPNTIGNYQILGYIKKSSSYRVRCILCNTESIVSKAQVKEWSDYVKTHSSSLTGKIEFCSNCQVTLTGNTAQPLVPKLRADVSSKVDIEISNNIAKVKLGNRTSKNTYRYIYLDSTDIMYGTVAITLNPAGNILATLASGGTMLLSRLMLGITSREGAVYHKNGIPTDFRRSNLFLAEGRRNKFNTGGVYRNSSGLFYFSKEYHYFGAINLFNTESEALLALREAEIATFKDNVYNPAYDFASIDGAIEMIFNGVSEEDLVKANLKVLAQNPWVCYRYNLFELLSKYNIPVADSKTSADGKICDNRDKAFANFALR